MDRGLVATVDRGFDWTLQKFGLWVVYTRSDHRFRCTHCFDLDTNEAPADCEFCFGTGFKTNLERWYVIYSNSLVRAGAYTPLARIGWTTEHTPYVFTKPHLIPSRGDRFFIVEWDQKPEDIPVRQAQPVRILETIRITFIEPNIAGRVIYYTNHCEFVTEAKVQYESVLLGQQIRITRSP